MLIPGLADTSCTDDPDNDFCRLIDRVTGSDTAADWIHLLLAKPGAIVGLILAPIVLRRMARRESGSRVAERREQAMQRNPF